MKIETVRFTKAISANGLRGVQTVSTTNVDQRNKNTECRIVHVDGVPFVSVKIGSAKPVNMPMLLVEHIIFADAVQNDDPPPKPPTAVRK